MHTIPCELASVYQHFTVGKCWFRIFWGAFRCKMTLDIQRFALQKCRLRYVKIRLLVTRYKPVDPHVDANCWYASLCYYIYAHRKCFGFLCMLCSGSFTLKVLSSLVNGVVCLLPTALGERRNCQCIEEACVRGSSLLVVCTAPGFILVSFYMFSRFICSAECDLCKCNAVHQTLIELCTVCVAIYQDWAVLLSLIGICITFDWLGSAPVVQIPRGDV